MMMKLFAFDLTTDPIHNDFLHSTRTKISAHAPPANLPGGFSSPMGFWLSNTETFSGVQAKFELIVSETDSSTHDDFNQTVTLKPDTKDELTIKLSHYRAHVIAKKTTWDRLSEAILLVITQYWRFSCIETQLNTLSNTSRNDLHYASKPKMTHLTNANRFIQNDIILRTLAQDMPFFEGPLMVATRYLHSPVLVKSYIELSNKLDLSNWAEQLDNHLETVGSAYEDITEKLFYHKGYLAEIVLEIMIVLILLIDLWLHQQ